MLQDWGSDRLPILLTVPLSPVFHLNEHPPSINFQKACWDDFAFYFDSYCFFCRGILVSFSFLCCCSLNCSDFECGQIFHSFRPHQTPTSSLIVCHVEEAVSESRKAFAVVHRSDEDCQAYISASQHASSVIAKAKAEAWQVTCSSLLPKSNPKSVYSLLRSVADPSSSSLSSSNFPNCSSHREWASVFANYLRSHFSVSQPKALHSRARGYLYELCQATYPEESHLSLLSLLFR